MTAPILRINFTILIAVVKLHLVIFGDILIFLVCAIYLIEPSIQGLIWLEFFSIGVFNGMMAFIIKNLIATVIN